jgi:hypothetical protein
MRAGAILTFSGMTLELTDEEAAALTKHLRQALDYARCRLAPRLDPLKSVLAKLEPPKPQPERFAAAETRHGTDRRAGTAETLNHPTTRCPPWHFGASPPRPFCWCPALRR